MPKKTVSLIDATLPQLRHFAEVGLGLEISNTNNSAQLIAKIRAANPGLTVFETEEEAEQNEAAQTIANTPAPVVTGEVRKLGSSYHDDPKVTILIPGSKEPGGDKDVQIACNGDVFLIQRDQETPIPFRVYTTLKDAREKEINQTIPKPGVPATITIRDVFSYPFQVLRMPSDEEIAAYHARTDNVELGMAA